MTDVPLNSPKIEEYIRKYNFKIGAQLGVCEARLSYYLLNTFPELTIVDVDIWSDVGKYVDSMNYGFNHKAQEELSRERLKGFGDRSIIVKSLTHEAAINFPDNHFDFVYIDSSHKGECLKAEVVAWYSKIKEEGLFCGHDYIDAWGGDYKAEINNIFSKGLVNTDSRDTSWFCWKKDINLEYLNKIRKELS